jgi:hypothetical protein
LWKKNQQHIVKIFYMWMFCKWTLNKLQKGNIIVILNCFRYSFNFLHRQNRFYWKTIFGAKSPSTEWSWFCIELIICFLYFLCNWIIAIFKECLNKSRNSHFLYRDNFLFFLFINLQVEHILDQCYNEP